MGTPVRRPCRGLGSRGRFPASEPVRGRFIPPWARLVRINQDCIAPDWGRFWLICGIPAMNGKRRIASRGPIRQDRRSKEKWGQPCGRPHSHRRWASGGSAYRQVSSKPRPGRNRSAAMSSPGARAGAGSTRGRFQSEDFSLPPGGSETGLSIKASGSPASPESFAVPRPSSERPTLPTLRPRGLNAFEIGIVRRRSCSLGSTARHLAVASIRFQNPFFRAGFWSLCFGRANPRLDVWKMRRSADSGNSATGQLSTSRLNVSGQGWITQRLGAESASYPRSRCASSRKRRALSLMKPAASCWS